MSSHPEVAITIVTGGQHGVAESGPTPMPLEQLPAAGCRSRRADAVVLGAVDPAAHAARPRRAGRGGRTSSAGRRRRSHRPRSRPPNAPAADQPTAVSAAAAR